MSDPLEPLAPELAALLGQLPKAPAVAARKAAVWQRVASSAAALPAAGGVAAGVLTGKVIVPLVIAALAVGTGAGVAVDRAVFPPAPLVVVRVERVEVPVPVPAPVPAEPKVEAPAPEPKLEPAPLPAAPPAPAVKRPHPAAASAEERQLIEAARTALIKRDPGAALSLIAQHRRTFASGQLAEERDSLEVQALVQDGRLDDARAAAHTFTTRYPHSVFSLPDF